eukprot:CAMPEP_0194317900 /NCGR_PEP_ID=MMETSP0171-20130528/14582_1 /TAXON_ID=218684 /ORGANISM="Corethron pennatum, Strain L29A3" /LENGTH=113 /DNA_ID=CAMNT_0039074631 /DNA_START=170 /DNA_END=511 /DNA_ORIENTATION=-
MACGRSWPLPIPIVVQRVTFLRKKLAMSLGFSCAPRPCDAVAGSIPSNVWCQRREYRQTDTRRGRRHSAAPQSLHISPTILFRAPPVPPSLPLPPFSLWVASVPGHAQHQRLV